MRKLLLIYPCIAMHVPCDAGKQPNYPLCFFILHTALGTSYFYHPFFFFFFFKAWSASFSLSPHSVTINIVIVIIIIIIIIILLLHFDLRLGRTLKPSRS